MAVSEATTQRLLTCKQLAKAFQVSQSTIRNYRKLGLPAVKVSSLVRFGLEDCTEWLKQNSARIGAES